MSIRFSVRRIPKEVGRSRRLMDYGTSAMSGARHGASHAVGWVQPMYGQTRRFTTDRVQATRGWTAPQIHRSADFFDGAVAPRISSALHGTASFIEPPRRHRRARSLFFGGTALVALGCVAVGMIVARRRSRLNDLLEPEIGVSEREYVEEHTTAGTYTPATGYSSSSYGGVGRGGGTGHSRGIGHD